MSFLNNNNSSRALTCPRRLVSSKTHIVEGSRKADMLSILHMTGFNSLLFFVGPRSTDGYSSVPQTLLFYHCSVQTSLSDQDKACAQAHANPCDQLQAFTHSQTSNSCEHFDFCGVCQLRPRPGPGPCIWAAPLFECIPNTKQHRAPALQICSVHSAVRM